MKKYTCILWDLDGTLTLSHPGIFNCFRYALEKMGRPQPTEQQLGLCVGPPLDWSFEHIFGLSAEDAQRAIAYYRERYEVLGWEENDPVEGALQALEILHNAGFKMALATSKPMHFATRISEKFGFAQYVLGEYEPIKPGYEPKKTEVIEKAIRLLGARKEDCLMVGDRKYDILGARSVGVDVAALDVGYAVEGEFEECPPDYYFADFPAIVKALMGETLDETIGVPSFG